MKKRRALHKVKCVFCGMWFVSKSFYEKPKQFWEILFCVKQKKSESRPANFGSFLMLKKSELRNNGLSELS
jgi:hypothetical protein